jgi:phospholipid/cholesterol/gamma-HCH transport system substrate-binding protein
METRANYALIGLFTLATIFGAAGFVYWFHHLSGTGERATYRVVFEGSVAGLRVGSAVLFNGIRVGEVSALDIEPKNSDEVVATIQVEKEKTPVRADTRIGLTFTGFTGVASLTLEGGTRTLPILTSSNANPAVLHSDPGLNRDVTQTAREVLARIDKFVADNQASLGTSIHSLETVTGALARNSDRIDSILAGIDNLAGGTEGKSEIAEAARAIRQLAENLDKRTAEISSGLNRLSGSSAREVEAVAADAHRTLGEIERTVRNFDRNPQRLLLGGGNSVPEYNGRR